MYLDMIRCNVLESIIEFDQKKEHDISLYNGYSKSYIDILENGDIKIIVDNSTGISISHTDNTINMSGNYINLKGNVFEGYAGNMFEIDKIGRTTLSEYDEFRHIKYDLDQMAHASRQHSPNTIIAGEETLIVNSFGVLDTCSYSDINVKTKNGKIKIESKNNMDIQVKDGSVIIKADSVVFYTDSHPGGYVIWFTMELIY